MSAQFVQGYVSEDRSVEMEHRDGLSWWEAPVPRRLHRCKPQTRGYLNWFTFVERCACGAIRMDGSHWMDRNSTRKRRRVSW
jgi:hypothetical protein